MPQWVQASISLGIAITLLTACAIIEDALPWIAKPTRIVQRTATETFISTLDPSSRAQTSLQISPDGKRVAYISGTGNEEFVVVDGKKENAFIRILSFLAFSPDSKRVAYVAAPASLKQLVVVDGKPGKQYDNVYSLLFFSPNSQRLAYIARPDARHKVVVVDGKESRPYEDIGFQLVYSPDSQHLAYAAFEQNQWFVVRDGKEETRYTQVSPQLYFSPDSQRLAYVAAIGDQWFAVIDGKREGPYNQRLQWIYFSPDSQHYAYVAHANNKSLVVLDGQPGKPYDEIFSALLFSPDSKHLAYAAKSGYDPLGARAFMVLDGRESKPYSGLRLIGWTAHGEHFIYLASLGFKFPQYTPHPTVQGPQVAMALIPLGSAVVIDDHEVAGPYHTMDIGDLNVAQPDALFFALFPTSPDGKRYALAARQDPYATGPQFMVVDGKEGQPYDEIIPLTSRFSPDSRRLVYAARVGSQQFVVVDGVEGKVYDGIQRGSVVFSPDSRHLVYVAQSGSNQLVVLDSTEGKAYDQVYAGSEMGFILGGRKIIFGSADTFRYLARRGNEIYLIQEKIQ